MPSGDDGDYVDNDDDGEDDDDGNYFGDGDDDDVDGEEVCLYKEFHFRCYSWPFIILYLLSGLGK